LRVPRDSSGLLDDLRLYSNSNPCATLPRFGWVYTLAIRDSIILRGCQLQKYARISAGKTSSLNFT